MTTRSALAIGWPGTLPCQLFADALAGRLGVDAVGYPFIVMDLHPSTRSLSPGALRLAPESGHPACGPRCSKRAAMKRLMQRKEVNYQLSSRGKGSHPHDWLNLPVSAPSSMVKGALARPRRQPADDGSSPSQSHCTLA